MRVPDPALADARDVAAWRRGLIVLLGAAAVLLLLWLAPERPVIYADAPVAVYPIAEEARPVGRVYPIERTP